MEPKIDILRIVLDVLAGVVVLLHPISQLSSVMKEASGDETKEILEKYTRNLLFIVVPEKKRTNTAMGYE